MIERNINPNLKKGLEFPMNPALSGKKQTKTNRLDDFVVFCKKKNIAFDDGELRYYKVMTLKKNHKIWSQTVNKLYEDYERELADTIALKLASEEFDFTSIKSPEDLMKKLNQ